ncbi:MAG: cation:proton antiporter [Acidobacteria bacterium]|nr:cation:proton antiporter [Acidobacteriota bacterium]
MNKLLGYLFCVGVLLAPLFGAAEGAEEASAHHVATFLFEIVAVLIAAKIGGELFERVKQPAVLGELVFGMVLGNLNLIGLTFMSGFKNDEFLSLAAEIGVILLLFEVGLESNIDELLAVGSSAMLVAVLGVIAPVILGYGVSMWFLPEAAWYVHLFVGATLAATSVGITARVLKDMRKMDTKEARIILGAAVVDDVLGLIILAVVSGLVRSIDKGAAAGVDMMAVLMIVGKAIAFLAVAVIAGRALAGRVLHFGSRAKVGGVPVVLSVAYCFLMAGLAETIGLAAIVGAFAAGLVLDNAHYQGYQEMRTKHIEELLAPISAIYVPVFFVLMGLRVDLSVFASIPVLEFAFWLSMAAILGKQVCALGVLEKGLNRIAIGVGMIPRGEVGLIFAGIGATLTVGGAAVFSSETFSAMVVMVMVTTLATPPLLKAMFAKTKTPASGAGSARS